MTREVVTVQGDTALTDLRALLHDRGLRHLLVVEGGDLVGVISDRDVLQALSLFLNTISEKRRDVQALAQPAAEIMRRDPATVTADTGIEEAFQLMLDHDISSLPVVEDGEILGIVTTQDLLRHYTEGA